eukprot:11140000-Heterocapsa_arctica.AAC.1
MASILMRSGFWIFIMICAIFVASSSVILILLVCSSCSSASASGILAVSSVICIVWIPVSRTLR